MAGMLTKRRPTCHRGGNTGAGGPETVGTVYTIADRLRFPPDWNGGLPGFFRLGTVLASHLSKRIPQYPAKGTPVHHLKRNLLSLIGLPLVALALAATPAQAILVSQSDAVFGADSVTLDTGTGLEWLDVNTSVNRSFNDVSGQFGAGGDFQGWRYATGAEVLNLIVSNTVPLAGASSPGEVTIGSAFAFAETLGPTVMSQFIVFPPDIASNAFGVEGIYAGTMAGEYGIGAVVLDGLTDLNDPVPSLFQFASSGVFDNVGISPFEELDFRGSWLVRGGNVTVQISEPGALALLGIVIAGIAFSRRHRRA